MPGTTTGSTRTRARRRTRPAPGAAPRTYDDPGRWLTGWKSRNTIMVFRTLRAPKQNQYLMHPSKLEAVQAAVLLARSLGLRVRVEVRSQQRFAAVDPAAPMPHEARRVPTLEEVAIYEER